MRKYLLGLSVFVIMAMALTACASNASGNGGSNSGSSGSTLNVTMSDFKFTPDAWTVNAGQQVTVNLNNTASIQHTWTIMKSPISGSYTSADQSDIYFNSGKVDPGATQTVHFTAPSTPGTYQVICTIPGHFEAGMKGELTVK